MRRSMNSFAPLTLVAACAAWAPSLHAQDAPPLPPPAAATPPTEVAPQEPAPTDAAPAPTAPTPSPAPADSAPAASPTDAPAASEPRPTDPRVLQTFRAAYLAIDPLTSKIYEGVDRRELSAKEVYAKLGRDDLVAEVENRERQRNLFYVAGAVTAAAGVASGMAVLFSARDVNDPYCTGAGAGVDPQAARRYNDECIPDHKRSQVIGGSLIVGGLLIGSGLVYWGSSIDTRLLGPEQTRAGVSAYNQSLMERARRDYAAGPTSAAPRPTQIAIVPSLGLDGGSVTARVTF